MSRARDLAGFSTATLGTNDLIVGVITASSYLGDGSGLIGVGGTWIATAAGIHTTKNVGIGTTNPIGAADSNNTAVVNAGVVTANYYYGDGSKLTNLPAGLGTAVAATGDGSKIYYTDRVLDLGADLSVDVPATATVAYTQYPEIAVSSSYDLTIADNDDLVVDILGIGTTGAPQTLAGGGGRIRADNFTDKTGYNAPTFANGVNVSLAVTATDVNVSGGSTLGIATATSIVVGSAVTANLAGVIVGGAVTATSFAGDGSSLTGVANTAFINATQLSITGITTTTQVLPAADATHDLGSSSARWANLYVADMNFSNKGLSNDVDGTWGTYTIQEGRDDLFLINNRSGKKYKFNLTEVQ